MNIEATKAMTGTWMEQARANLLGLRKTAGAWGYRWATECAVEPTALATLALLADREYAASPAAPELRRAADWVVALQAADGSLGVSAALPAPRWSTAHGLLLWNALGGYAGPCERAAGWLLAERGVVVPNLPAARRTVGHDTTLMGWPWVAETHSWLEPTALAILALRAQGKEDHPRVREGVRLIHDRAIASGGWNYGNKEAFGAELRPQPAATGLALLALAGLADRCEPVERGLRYLQEALPATRAPQSLCWGVLALRAWKCCPAAADGWLAESFERFGRGNDTTLRPAHLVLAAARHSLLHLRLPTEEGAGS